MARVRNYLPEDDYDPDEDSDPDFDDDVDDDDAVENCPYCKAEIYEGSSACPKCGQYISKEDRDERTLPGWVSVTALVLVIAMTLSVLAML